MYLVGAAAVALLLSVGGAPFTYLLPFAFLLVCLPMMFFMMKGMGGLGGGSSADEEDHTVHGCEHDTTPKVEPPSRRS